METGPNNPKVENAGNSIPKVENTGNSILETKNAGPSTLETKNAGPSTLETKNAGPSTLGAEAAGPSFEYVQNTQMNPTIKGLFVFSFYFKRDTFERKEWIEAELSVERNGYLKGIFMYIDALNRPDSVFKEWKILLYTDQFSYLALQKYSVFPNGSLDYCIVRWPYYTPVEGGALNGDVMRVMRFRAFFDFLTIPVFVRDADTLFAQVFPTAYSYVRIVSDDKERLYEWEKSYYEGALKHPNTWIFGSSLGYTKAWHENTLRGLQSAYGAFAGLQSTMPTVPCFKNEGLWDSAMKYILESSERVYEDGTILYSNRNDPMRIGKDERTVVFIFLANCNIENIFFFELDMFGRRNNKLQFTHQNYPKKIFERGSNANLKASFQAGKNKQFKVDKKPEPPRVNKPPAPPTVNTPVATPVTTYERQKFQFLKPGEKVVRKGGHKSRRSVKKRKFERKTRRVKR